MIDKNTSIMDVLRLYPEAREVFVKYGMACSGCLGSTKETVENGAKLHDVNVDALLSELKQLTK